MRVVRHTSHTKTHLVLVLPGLLHVNRHTSRSPQTLMVGRSASTNCANAARAASPSPCMFTDTRVSLASSLAAGGQAPNNDPFAHKACRFRPQRRRRR